jgi:diacylglycerol kinase family enzyme
MTAFVVFNPNADGGRTGRDWREIEEALERIFPAMHFFVTTAPTQAAHMVRDALRDGLSEIIAIGGDGTINEALNGFFDHGAAVSPDAVFNFVHAGRGDVICRKFGIEPGWRAGVAQLAHGRLRKCDIGRVSCLTACGAPVTRYFLAGASFGLSAALQARLGAARIAPLLGAGFAQRLHTALARLSWRGAHVRLLANGHDEIAGITSVALEPCDGGFDIAVQAGKSVRQLASARLTAAPTVETRVRVAVETDGESAGTLPATFEFLPAAINLRL